MSNVGIYAIKNTITNQYYVGQSSNIDARFRSHKYSLNNGNHSNPSLQKSYDEYGEDNFEFMVLENCSINQLNDLEVKYIDELDSIQSGFNSLRGGGSCIVRVHEHNEITTIRLRQSTLEALRKLKKENMTYEDVLLMLIHTYEESNK